jgi:hypothetical protein
VCRKNAETFLLKLANIVNPLAEDTEVVPEDGKGSSWLNVDGTGKSYLFKKKKKKKSSSSSSSSSSSNNNNNNNDCRDSYSLTIS